VMGHKTKPVIRLDTFTNKMRLETEGLEVFAYLYAMLMDRPDYANISHRGMPTFAEHCKFVLSEPYRFWWLIVDFDGKRLGTAYVTFPNEVGVFIESRFRGQGYGSAALDAIENHPCMGSTRLLANVAATNSRSADLFTGRDYKLLQRTFFKDIP